MYIHTRSTNHAIHHDSVQLLSHLYAGGEFVTTASKDGHVNVWSTKDLSPVAQLQGHQGAVYCCAASPMGDAIAAVSKDSYARIWSVSDLATDLGDHCI